MAVKPKDIKWEEAALRKRLEFVRSLKQALAQDDSLAAQTVSAYSSLIDDIIKEVAVEVHRAVKTGVDDLSDVRRRQQQEQEEEQSGVRPRPAPAAQTTPLALGVQVAGGKAAIDMFGNQVAPVALDHVSCPSCYRAMAAGRFAVHLEKCMGRGRQASRGANAAG